MIPTRPTLSSEPEKPMPAPEISVLINNYNYGRYVARAIDSALSQQGVSFEVIVVDDGSTDDSRQVIADYGHAVRAVLQRNQGQAAAMNAAVAASRGAILCFLDADDWFMPGKLAAIASAFADTPEAGLVYHRLQPTGNDDAPLGPPIPRTLCQGDIAPRMARSAGVWPFPMTSAISVRREAWDCVGAIPARFRISADAWLVGAIPFVFPIVALPQALGGYRIHDNTWHRASDDAPMLRRRMAHWEATVEELNAFLTARDLGWRLDMADHFPHFVAASRLRPIGLADRTRLFLRGLRFAGEPHVLRRGRDALRTLRLRQTVDPA
ncbi:glycosyltransferase family 2 protein [Paracoccus indicus]|uniref:glycosyltransferase family 2 protein n=1 Tax=Paracoccus indicus TaxID=2079229 RepID=UPI001FE9F12F|nr:glycosyltransferase family 2 protein [Paracoccus indicus]